MFANRSRPVLALLAVLVLVLGGCGRGSSTAGGGGAASSSPIPSGPATGTITMWAQGAEGAALPKLLTEFEAANPGVKVNVTPIPWDAAFNKYQTAIAGGSTPDIAQIGTTWVGNFANAFETPPAEIDTSKFYPSAVEATKIDGTAYAVPWYVDTRVVFYRTDLAEKAGITKAPQTWDEFKALAKAYQTKAGSKWGVQLRATSGSMQSMLPFGWSNGAELMNSDQSKWTLNTTEWTQAFAYYQSLYAEGIANKNGDNAGSAEAAFVDGSAPMMISGPYEIGLLNDAGGKNFASKYAVAPVPKEKTATSYIGGADLAVFKKAQNRDGAWKLAQWLSQPEIQVKWAQLTGDLPADQSAWSDSSLANDGRLKVFQEQLGDTKAPPTVPTWTEVSDAADKQIEQMIRTNEDPAKALSELQSTADGIGAK